MIRLVQRQLIIPRGDTGTFSVPVIATQGDSDASIFTIFDPLLHKKIFEKEMVASDGVLNLTFTHKDTVNLPIGQYVWDIKFYKNVVKMDGVFVDGDEVDSYYAAFKLPVCEIRQTGDALLTADDAPTSTLSPESMRILDVMKQEIEGMKDAVDVRAAEVEEVGGQAAQSASDANEASVAASAAAAQAAADAAAVEETEQTIRNLISQIPETDSAIHSYTISGVTPTISALTNSKYTCGEVTSLNFTPCAQGSCEVIFTSGTTPTNLILPSTVKMPEWFVVEESRIYDIIISDGIYGAVMSWQA